MNKSKKLSIIVLTCIIMSLTISTVASAADDPWDWTSPTYFFGLGLAICLLFILLPVIIAILACIWIYKDAEKRGKSGAVWVLLLIVASLFFSFIGFVIVIVVWLATRPPIGETKGQTGRICPNCGRPIPMDAQVCPYCGKDFRQQ